MNLPVLKVYEIDYEFIIKNYLDPKLWNKIWTVFVYDHYVFTLMMSSINVKSNTIWFEVGLKGNDEGYWYSRFSESFSYNINNSNITMLKKSLQGTMLSLVNRYENQLIEDSEVYKELYGYYQEEDDRLREIAEQFLNENNVTNEEIRDVYIDYYVDENSQLYSKLDSYKSSKRYKVLTSLYLILAQVLKREDLEELVMEANKYDIEINNILKEVKEIVEYMETDEWVEEMTDNLGSL